MKADEVLKLIDAGFTRDEIISMDNPGAEPHETPEDSVGKTEDIPAPAVGGMPEEFKTALNDILKSFKSVADDIKKSNIANSRMADQEQTSAEQILASIIAPPAKERGKN